MATAILAGIGDGSLLFLVASGLTLIFGVMRILNFSHGGYFMLGGYFTYAIINHSASASLGLLLFIGAIVAGSLLVGVIGVVTERLIFRRIYKLPDIASLLGTFGLLLVMEGAAQVIWGVSPLSVPFPTPLAGSTFVAGIRASSYSMILIVVGIIVALALWVLLRKTTFGEHARAVAEDRYVCELVGMNTSRVSTIVFVIGTVLAGIGGGLATPLIAVTPDLATTFIIQAFAIVIVGGLGSVAGSLIAAIVFGIADSLAITYYPTLAGVTFYLLMFIVLLVRPQGLVPSAHATA